MGDAEAKRSSVEVTAQSGFSDIETVTFRMAPAVAELAMLAALKAPLLPARQPISGTRPALIGFDLQRLKVFRS